MPRAIRMPDLFFDKTKNRFFAEKRVPKEVRDIIGKPTKRKHTFPRSVDRDTATRLTREIVAGWEREWDAARPVQLVAVTRQPPWSRKDLLREVVAMAGQTGSAAMKFIAGCTTPATTSPCCMRL